MQFDDDDGDGGGQGARGKHLSVAHLQISHADVVIINKADLVTKEELQTVEERVRSINALAKIRITDHSQVPGLEGLVLDLHAYDNVTAESLEFASKGHSHLDPAIGTVTLELPMLDESGFERLDAWLRTLLWENQLPGEPEAGTSWGIHRIKGRIALGGGELKMLQGVREIFEFIDAVDGQSEPNPGEPGSGGKIVLIGREISALAQSFQQSLSASLNPH